VATPWKTWRASRVERMRTLVNVGYCIVVDGVRSVEETTEAKEEFHLYDAWQP